MNRRTPHKLLTLIKLLSSATEKKIMFDKVAFSHRFLAILQALTLLQKFRCCERFAFISRIHLWFVYLKTCLSIW